MYCLWQRTAEDNPNLLSPEPIINKKSIPCTLKAEKVSGKLLMATLQAKPSDQQMNYIKKALLIKTNEHIDEEATLLIDGSTIVCFASACPYKIKAGKHTTSN